ncbi:MAG TPA: hypothetical protein VF714_05650, partial [Jatrophihabitans sp.]
MNPAARSSVQSGLDALPARLHQQLQGLTDWLNQRSRPGLTRLSAAWRRSLQLRVATTTTIVTGLIVLL